MADLQHQLSGGRELQDHVVAGAGRGRPGPAAVAADPDEVLASTKIPCSRSGQS